MPRRLIATLAVLVVAAACSGDDDDAGPASTTLAPTTLATTTTTIPPSLTERSGDVAFPATRRVDIRDATLAPGEAIGFAFHPNGTITQVSASNPSVELCPATTDGVIDLTGGSWPGGAFAACLPLDEGVPSPGTAYHVGWALRSTATGEITIDATITYDATDGFFLWAPPPACGVLAFTPESDLVGVSGPQTIVRQGGTEIPLHLDDDYGHDLRVGRVVTGEEATVTCAPTGNVLVDWT